MEICGRDGRMLAARVEQKNGMQPDWRDAPLTKKAPYKPYLKRIFEAFGSDRIMWGSDLTRLPCSYAECLDHMRRELHFLTEDDRTRVLGGTAAALLRWPEPRSSTTASQHPTRSPRD